MHTLFGVDLAGTLISGIASQEVSPGVQEVIASADGATEPGFASVGGAQPRIEFDTYHLAAALTACGLAGTALSATPANFWFQARAAGGLIASGSSHIKLTQNAGLFIPLRITAEQGGNAMIRLLSQAIYDGTNQPYVIANNQAVSGSPALAELFTLGPTSINGAEVGDVISVTLDLGIRLVMPITDGEIYPRVVAIASRNPTLRIRTLNAASLATLGLTGVATSAWIQYFRKKASGTGNVADATEQHISFTGTTGQAVVNSLSGRQGDNAQAEIVVTSLALPAFDTTAAIA